MLSSFVRTRVLELLDEYGPLTTNELVAHDPALSPGTLRSKFLRWLDKGWITRRRARDLVKTTYRYSITEAGRAVLVGDREDREPLDGNRSRGPRSIAIDGEVLTIAEAATRYGLNPKTLRRRLERGFVPEEAVRPRYEPRRVEIDGEWVTLLEAAQRAGVTYDSVRRRIAEGRAADLVAAPAYFRKTCSRDAIRQLLQDAPRSLTRLEIGRALGAHEDAVRGHLDRMRADGELHRERAATQGAPWLYSLA